MCKVSSHGFLLPPLVDENQAAWRSVVVVEGGESPGNRGDEVRLLRVVLVEQGPCPRRQQGEMEVYSSTTQSLFHMLVHGHGS